MTEAQVKEAVDVDLAIGEAKVFLRDLKDDGSSTVYVINNLIRAARALEAKLKDTIENIHYPVVSQLKETEAERDALAKENAELRARAESIMVERDGLAKANSTFMHELASSLRRVSQLEGVLKDVKPLIDQDVKDLLHDGESASGDPEDNGFHDENDCAKCEWMVVQHNINQALSTSNPGAEIEAIGECKCQDEESALCDSCQARLRESRNK